MPKTKKPVAKIINSKEIIKEPKVALKETPLLDDEEKEVDPELIPGTTEEEDADEIDALDDDEVDPFKDKWEE